MQPLCRDPAQQGPAQLCTPGQGCAQLPMRSCRAGRAQLSRDHLGCGTADHGHALAHWLLSGALCRPDKSVRRGLGIMKLVRSKRLQHRTHCLPRQWPHTLSSWQHDNLVQDVAGNTGEACWTVHCSGACSCAAAKQGQPGHRACLQMTVSCCGPEDAGCQLKLRTVLSLGSTWNVRVLHSVWSCQSTM